MTRSSLATTEGKVRSFWGTLFAPLERTSMFEES